MRLSSLLTPLPGLLALTLLGALLVPSGATLLSADESSDKPPSAPAAGGDTATEEDPDAFDGPTSFTQKQVNTTIDKGIAWLKKQQKRDGGYGDLSGAQNAGSYDGNNDKERKTNTFAPGLSALVAYTLLKCHVSPKDPAVKHAFEYIKKGKEDEPDSSYATSMLLLAICATADQSKSTKAGDAAKPVLGGEYRGWAQKLATHLVKMREKGNTLGWRHYQKNHVPPGGNEDLSATQLAALALFAAHRCGVKVTKDVWEDILKYSLQQQQDDGPTVTWTDPVTKKSTDHKSRGFCYIKAYTANPHESNPSSGMTACGVANVMMARYVLSDAGRLKEKWDARPDAAKVQQSIYDGLSWIQANWRGYKNLWHDPRSDGYTHYWHYALERAMDLVGQQKLGEHLWYSQIGQELINRQEEKGSWRSQTTPYEPNDVLDTCFALLFLRRATKGTIPFPDITGGTDEPVDNR
jgi:hypothetical protein